MKHRLVYEPYARQLLRQLPPDLKPAVKEAIESLRDDPYAGKALKLDLAGFRSLRSKRYRIIYRIASEQRIVEIYFFGRRRDVYESFRRLIRS